jgi:hypothetical protein
MEVNNLNIYNSNNSIHKFVPKVDAITNNATSTASNNSNLYEGSPKDCINLNTSNSTDHCDMTSLEILNKCHLDLFPKKKTICDDVDCMSIVEQLPILNGEYIQFIGNLNKKTFSFIK